MVPPAAPGAEAPVGAAAGAGVEGAGTGVPPLDAASAPPAVRARKPIDIAAATTDRTRKSHLSSSAGGVS